MDIKIIIIIGFSYLYGFFELFMNLRQRGKSTGRISGDKGSLWVLYILITLGYALSFSIGATKIGRMNHWNVFFAVGVVLVVIGLIIRITSILTLKQYFTYSITQTEEHKLIETGLYKIYAHIHAKPNIRIYTSHCISPRGYAHSRTHWLLLVNIRCAQPS
jgi:protein-S-isoprenylcysteine O-methyltransferase Ste14